MCLCRYGCVVHSHSINDLDIWGVLIPMYSSSGTSDPRDTSSGISGIERQVSDICSMLTKTVADVASVYDQNVNLTGYKNIVGQVVSGLPQYQEMECENKRLVVENRILNRRIVSLEELNKRLTEEAHVENIKLEIEEVVVDVVDAVEKQELAEETDEDDAEQELAEETDEDDAEQELAEETDEDDAEQELAEESDEDDAEQELAEETDEDDAEQELAEETDEEQELAEETDEEQELAEETEDSDIELEEVEIDGTMYFVEVGDDDEKCAIFNVTGDDEVGDEIGFMLNGDAEFE